MLSACLLVLPPCGGNPITHTAPPTHDRCPQVLFDYFLEPSLATDAAFVAASLAASDRVQREDIALCESVQRGLASPAYDAGRSVAAAASLAAARAAPGCVAVLLAMC